MIGKASLESKVMVSVIFTALRAHPLLCAQKLVPGIHINCALYVLLSVGSFSSSVGNL